MTSTADRFIAFILGDAARAEGFEKPVKGPVPEWIKHAASDEPASKVALELALKSLELADAAVASVQAKASTHLTLLLALVPFALGATTLVSPPKETSGILIWLPAISLIASDACLAVAIAVAALASGLTQSGGISLTRLGALADRLHPGAVTDAATRSAATEAIRVATLYAYASGSRVAQDLFTARRWTVISVSFAILGIAGATVILGSGILRSQT